MFFCFLFHVQCGRERRVLHTAGFRLLWRRVFNQIGFALVRGSNVFRFTRVQDNSSRSASAC